MSLLWINGTLIDKGEARISPFDHGLLYGDGVWEPLRVVKGKVVLAAEHLEQLFASAGSIGLSIPLTVEETHRAVETTLAANGRVDGYARIIVTRGAGTIGPDPRKLDPQVIIIAEQYHPYPMELLEHGLHAVISRTLVDSDSPLFRARVLGQPFLALAKLAALQQGCLEAVLANGRGELVGATEGLLFIVKSGEVILASGYQPEATGLQALKQARQSGLRVCESVVRVEDMNAAEEVFTAGTSAGVIGIVRVNGRDVGAGVEGSVTRAVREAYQKLAGEG